MIVLVIYGMVIVKEAERLKLSLGTRRSVVQNIKRRNREKEA